MREGSPLRMMVLRASDPYAVVGVTETFAFRPDLVTGIASNARAGVEVEKLTDLPCLNVRDKDTRLELDRLLRERLASFVPGIEAPDATA